MPKPAIIELDSAIVELRTSLHQDFQLTRKDVSPEAIERAVSRIFDVALCEYLDWVDFTSAQSLDLVNEVQQLLQLPDRIPLDALETVINEYVHHPIIGQLQAVIGTDRYNAWNVIPVGTARVLHPGGIMVDLDRLPVKTGVVEIDLKEHWKHGHVVPAKRNVTADWDDLANEVNEVIVREQIHQGVGDGATCPNPHRSGFVPAGDRKLDSVPRYGRKQEPARNHGPHLSDTGIAADLERDRERPRE